MAVAIGQHMWRHSFSLIFSLLLCVPVQAGAWLQKSGRASAIYQVSYTRAHHSFGPEQIHSFHKILVKSYTEYALSDRVVLFSEPQYTIARVNSVYGLSSGRDYAVASGIRLGLVSGINMFSAEVRYQYGQTFSLTVSDGVRRSQQAEIRLLYGRNFYLCNHKIFTDFEGFWRWTSLPRPNETGFDMTLGGTLSPDTQILLQNFSVLSAGYGADSYPRYALHKAEMSVVQHLYHTWFLQLGVIYAYSGRNMVAERGVTLSVWLSL